MLKNATEWLEVHKSKETSSAFFDTVIFCTNTTYANGHFKAGRPFPHIPTVTLITIEVDLTSRPIATADTDPLQVQSELAVAWLSLVPEFPKDNIHVLPSIEHAIRVVRGIESEGGEGVDVLVAGSLHLVGGVIEVAGLSDVAL